MSVISPKKQHVRKNKNKMTRIFLANTSIFSWTQHTACASVLSLVRKKNLIHFSGDCKKAHVLN